MNDKNTKKIFLKFKTLMKKKEMKAGIECGDGWNQIISDMCSALVASNPPAGFKITRIFDRFDELKVFTVGGVNSTRFIIEAASELSTATCGACGNLRELQQCEKCKEKDDGSSTYVPDIAAAIAPAESTVTPDPHASVVLTTNPSDYYFKLGNDPTSVPPDYFMITPKTYWDATQSIYDQELGPMETILNNNLFYGMAEGVYEYAGLASAGHALLLSLGFIENLNLPT